MTRKYFEAEVRHRPDVAIIDLSGELTGQASDMLNTAYIAAIGSNPDVVFLNFARVTYLNSTGIALIISLLAQAQQANRLLVVYNLRPFYAELFELAGLTDYMPVLSTPAGQPEAVCIF